MKSIYFKNSIYLLLSVIVIFHFFTCEQESMEPEPVYPEVSLISPEDSSIIYNTDSLLLKWDCPNASSFNLYLDTLDNPVKLIVESRLLNYFNLIGLGHNTKYFWKIVANLKTGKKIEGEIWNFTTIDFDSTQFPHNPNPQDIANTFCYDLTLRWQCEGTNVFDIYFDNKNPPVNLLTSNSWGSFRYITGLHRNTTYYWQIVGKYYYSESTKGPIWTFTNVDYNNIYYPHNPTPLIGAEKQQLNLSLNWNCEKGKFYTVYLDTINPPENLLSTTNNNNLQASGLKTSTQYFWEVDAILENNVTTEGPVWNFNTKELYSDLCFDMNDAILLLKEHRRVVTGYTTYVSVDTAEEIYHYNINPEFISNNDKVFEVDNDTIFFAITSGQYKTIKGWILPDTINQTLDFYYKYRYYNYYSYPGVYSSTTNTYSFNLFQIPYILDQNSNYEINLFPSQVISYLSNINYYYNSYYNNQGELGDTRKYLLQFNGLNNDGNFKIIINTNEIYNR